MAYLESTSDASFDELACNSSEDLEKLIQNQPSNFLLLFQRPELLERVLPAPSINDESPMILNCFRFFAEIITHKEQGDNLATLVIFMPSSPLLSFAYKHLSRNGSSFTNDLGLYLSQVLNFLLELHPTCWNEIESIGLFDRLEWLSKKELTDNETQVEIDKLILKVEELRVEQEKVVAKKKQAIVHFERDDPPPNDFHQLSIYPSLEEIFEQQMPYLRRNITEGAYRDGTHYLDIHFRLLREDFLRPLREAICEYVTKPPAVKFQSSDVRLYTNVVYAGCVCSQIGILFALQLDLRTLPVSIQWAHTRRLIFGNLLAATYDDFNTSCFLLSIEDRSNIEQSGIVYVRSQQELAGTKITTLPIGTPLIMLETTAYFEASRPILKALQNITDDQIPLERYLLKCDVNVDLPAYLDRSNDQIDLRPVSNGFINMSNIKDFTTWPTPQQMGLDQSQYEAVKLALTKAVALIQEKIKSTDTTAAATAESLPTSDNTDHVDLLEDDEEIRRRENQDVYFFPAGVSSLTNLFMHDENSQESGCINAQSLEFMQNLLNSPDGTRGIPLEAEVSNIQNLWSLNRPQRCTLYRFWLRKYAQKLTETMRALIEEYGETQHLIEELRHENDVYLMQNAFIIAMTTHCAARYQKVLKKIKPRICIVEEAAEVFESHIVTAVGEDLEHLILIGDHEQLRPSPNVYTLAKRFNLDVSLFERLIKNKMLSIQLCVQHRSIPIISSLFSHFYDIPIENHLSVLNRISTLKGITYPLFFIDHRHLEESVIEGSSKRNVFEADFVLNLAYYLVQNGVQTTQITILATYMGQRQMIHDKL